jgi:polysaccharide deacetylase 2 family uncharacterized protein YibQ
LVDLSLGGFFQRQRLDLEHLESSFRTMSRRSDLRPGIPAWQKNLTLVFCVGMAVILAIDFFARHRTPGAAKNAKTSPSLLEKAAKGFADFAAPKTKTPPKEERIRLATDRVLTNFGIRVEWIKYQGHDRNVRVPKEIDPLVIYQVLSNQVRQLGGKVESGTEDLRTGETTLLYSFAGKMLGKIRLIPDATLTRHAGKIAIIIDDFGYAVGDIVNELMRLEIPITYSIIPGVKFSKEIAARLHKAGKPIMIHMPMQALEKAVENDSYSLMLDMKPEEIRERVRKAIAAVPHAAGMNNHMGSAATVNDSLMAAVFDELQKANLFFIDSKTNSQTRAFKLATKRGLPAEINDIFLDNEEGWERVQHKMWQVADLAAAEGAAIAIGHPHASTLRALKEIGPQLVQRGFEFVPVAELIRPAKPEEKILASQK